VCEGGVGCRGLGLQTNFEILSHPFIFIPRQSHQTLASPLQTELSIILPKSFYYSTVHDHDRFPDYFLVSFATIVVLFGQGGSFSYFFSKKTNICSKTMYSIIEIFWSNTCLIYVFICVLFLYYTRLLPEFCLTFLIFFVAYNEQAIYTFGLFNLTFWDSHQTCIKVRTHAPVSLSKDKINLTISLLLFKHFLRIFLRNFGEF
jgi:hypothetical protein